MISDTESEIARARLQAVVENLDGFELARKGLWRSAVQAETWPRSRADGADGVSPDSTIWRCWAGAFDSRGYCWLDDFDLKKPENQALKSEAIRVIGRSVSRFCVGLRFATACLRNCFSVVDRDAPLA